MFPVDILTSTPHSPGVYLMLDKKSTVLYVGKAKDLRNRLASYARLDGTQPGKTAALLSHIHTIDTLLTRTEKEALILEASLIKQHHPKYNIILRDDKNYPLIKVTIQEEWPRVMMTRRRKKDGARYFGPFVSSSAMWESLKLIASLFPLRRCKTPRLPIRTRPCLNGQMHHCLAPCMGAGQPADRERYQEMVKQVLLLLEGHNRELIAAMTTKMEAAAADLAFEQAATLRDQIQALTKTLEKQIVVASHRKDQDIFGLARKDASLAIALLLVRNGIISGSRSFFFADPIGDDATILAQALLQYYSAGDTLPREILLPGAAEGQELLAERLSEMSGETVRLLVPQRGDKMSLIDMANANARQLFADRDRKEQSWQTLAAAIMDALHLPHVPDTIECVDISNISGQQAVGSLVCFQQGEPAPPQYRHYTITSVVGPDDYGMMAEVLKRRLARGIADNTLPDLLMVDGGRGQLGVATGVIKELARETGVEAGQKMALVAIAKEKQGEGEKLFIPGRKNPILLPAHNPALLYLMRIRDESHRYGVRFHRHLRSKNAFHSPLDGIDGIGPQKKQALLTGLGSVRRIRQATREQLREVAGIGPELAALIYRHFHPENEHTEKNASNGH